MPKIHGTIYIVSAPSGAGKTSLVRALVGQAPDLRVSISHTTRPKRPGEVDGIDYYFVSQGEFFKLRDEGAFIETAQVFGHYYGTSKMEIERAVKGGQDLVLEIDWQGAEQIEGVYPKQTVRIFILPPSKIVLQERLENRAQDHPEIIAARMAEAKSEMQQLEREKAIIKAQNELQDIFRKMGQHLLYEYLIVNDQFEQALEDLKAIVRAERHKTWRQRELRAKLIKELLA